MPTKRSIEILTRKARARAIFRPLDLPSPSALIMKIRAMPKLAMMATNARMTQYFMDSIIS